MLNVYKNIGPDNVVVEQLQVTGSPFQAGLATSSYFTFLGSSLSGASTILVAGGDVPLVGDVVSICLVSGCTFDDGQPRVSLNYIVKGVDSSLITVDRLLPDVGSSRDVDTYTGAATTPTGSGLVIANTIDGTFETLEKRYSNRCFAATGTKKTIISAMTGNKQITIATFSAETNYEQISHFNSTVTIPNIMWHENTTMGLTLSDSGSSLYKSEADESYYGKLKVNGDGSSVGKIFYDRKLIVIDDQELAAVLCYCSNRNYTLPKAQISLIKNPAGTTGFTMPKTSYYVTYKIVDGNNDSSCFCSPSIMHCRYITRLDDKDGRSDISILIPDFNFSAGTVNNNTGFTVSSIDVLVGTGETDSNTYSNDSWKVVGQYSGESIVNLSPYSSSTKYNPLPLSSFASLTAGGILNEYLSPMSWSGNSMATVYKMRVMCHGSHEEFNDTMNPSFQKSSRRPIYISEVGLYNKDNVLLGVAKLSVPVVKNIGDIVTIEVNYDF